MAPFHSSLRQAAGRAALSAGGLPADAA